MTWFSVNAGLLVGLDLKDFFSNLKDSNLIQHPLYAGDGQETFQGGDLLRG